MHTENDAGPSLAHALAGMLGRLYREQLADGPNPYLQYHSSRQAVLSRVNSFLEYADFLPASGTVLDWGCQHAPDACMVRAVRPDADVGLHGCDFVAEDKYSRFWKQCGLKFSRLEHHVALPYADGFFDCAIGGGVLEHVAMDYESLKELYRVLKPGGVLVLTHLPNRYSYVEFAARNVRRRDFHQKLYTVSGIGAMLKHTGFAPDKIRRHRLLPSNSLDGLTRLLAPYERAIDRIWPLNLLCGDILVVARKVSGF